MNTPLPSARSCQSVRVLRAGMAGLAFLLLLFTTIRSGVSQEAGPVLTRVSEPVDHGEGPHWDSENNILYYVDISGMTLHRYNPETDVDDTLVFDGPVGIVVPVRGEKHKLVVVVGLQILLLTWDPELGFNSTSPIVTVDQGARFNDGKADARGRLWAGTMGLEEPVGVVTPNRGTLYRLDNDPSVPCRADPMLTPVSISNGLAWTADHKVMYYIDTPTRRVDAFDYDLDNGTIANRRTVFEFGETAGSPDGMTIDSNGNLWIACWSGSQVIQVNPSTGQLLRQVKLPVERVTSVSFGGAALDELYVTTMRTGLSPEQLKEQPLAGSLWKITQLGVKGVPANAAVVNCKCNN